MTDKKKTVMETVMEALYDTVEIELVTCLGWTCPHCQSTNILQSYKSGDIKHIICGSCDQPVSIKIP